MATNNNIVKVSTHINQLDGVSNVHTYQRGNLMFELTKNYCYRVVKETYMVKTFKEGGSVISNEIIEKTTRIPLNTKPTDPLSLLEKMKQYQPRKTVSYEKAWIDKKGNIVVKKKLL